jgi:hypothetical protein
MKKVVSNIAVAAAIVAGTVLVALGSSANASTFQYVVSGTDNANGLFYNANITLDVSGGQASSGTGTISGALITGLLGGPQSLTLVTPATPEAETPLGYRSSTGTDLFGVTDVVPVDNNGLLFIIGTPFGPGLNSLFAFWSDPGAGAIFSGTPFGATDYASSQATLSEQAPNETPLPAALPLFATGLGMMGLLGWRRKRKNAAIAAA